MLRVLETPPVVGVDLGGTMLRAALVDADGAVLQLERRRHAATDYALVLDALADVVERLQEHVQETPIAAVGVGVAAFLDAGARGVRTAVNLHWTQRPLADDLEARLGLPVALLNDGDAGALGEHRHGAGRGRDSLVLVTVGTGVGGGAIVDGRLMRGGTGVGSELGHLCVDPGGRPCPCGARGCLERYASGTALAASSPEEVGGWLGRGLAQLVAMLDPELLLVGGGVAAAGVPLLEPTRRSLAANLPLASCRRPPQLALAQLGDLAGVVGA
ncbi:MAG TPA: ROK family protein, partial [Conexibacter sp.]|nr:ROK family protein [Conexibacter sp.]